VLYKNQENIANFVRPSRKTDRRTQISLVEQEASGFKSIIVLWFSKLLINLFW